MNIVGRMRRREFLKVLATASAAGSVMPRHLWAAETGPTVCVVHGKDVRAMLDVGVRKMGGWNSFVKKGQKATVKPNAAWASRPEEGGNTTPELIAACVAACASSGASEVVLPEVSCSDHRQSFAMSGIGEAAKKAGGRLYAPGKKGEFRSVKVPLGRKLREAEVVADVLDTGCLVNVPVAKSHGGAVLTVSMKNWMGSVKDRGFWHRNNLHQCIADLSTLVKPHLIVVDATRIMLTNGPRGPGEMAYPQQLILGTDPVAVDAYAATLFKKDPFSVGYIKIAHDMKIGCGDLSRVNVVHVDA